MAWNNGLERKKFDELQKSLAEKYRAADMSEEMIRQLYEFDLAVFHSKRRYYEHTQQFPENILEESGDDKSPLFEKFEDALSNEFEVFTIVDSKRWMDEIESPQLLEAVKRLSAEDAELLRLYVFEHCTQREIGIRFGISQSGVCKRLKRLRNFFGKLS